MKKMSSETKYFMYELLVVVGSMIAFFGSLVLGILWTDTLIHINPLLGFVPIGIVAALGYWNLIVWEAFMGSDDSQEEDC